MHINPPTNEQEDLFKKILDTVSDGVTVIDKDLKIQYQNKIIVQLFGSKIGGHCYKVYRNRKEPCVDCIVLEVLKDGKERRGIRDIPLPDGGISLVEISSAALRNAEGKIIGATEVAREVTDQKKAEALLNRSLLEHNEVLKQLYDELSDAAGYVKTVLPQKINSGALLTEWRFIPSATLGGDSFGYHWLDEDHFALYLVDVSGHGWAASLLSVSVINMLRSGALPNTDFYKPAQVLFALNNTFPSEQHNDMFFTIWYGVYCISSHQLIYASGGHPPALLFSDLSLGNSQIKMLRTPNAIIGGAPDTIYQSKIQEVSVPARLFVFSDGVFEITKSDGSIWGFNEFSKFMKKSLNADQSSLDSLLSYAQQLSRKVTFDDDFSVIEIFFN